MIVAENYLGADQCIGHLQLVRNALNLRAPASVGKTVANAAVTSPGHAGPLTSSCGATFVAMMQTTHLGERDNLACGG